MNDIRTALIKSAAIYVLFLLIFQTDTAHSATESIRIAAISGEQAPGTTLGSIFAPVAMGTPVINNAGQVAFYARVLDGPLISQRRTGIWSEGGGALDLVVIRGMQVAGFFPGETFGSLTESRFAFNDRGNLAFHDRVLDTAGSTFSNAIWLHDGNDLSLAVKTGDPAPTGIGDSHFNFVGHPVINRHGEIAFYGGFDTEPNVDFVTSGIWTLSGGTIEPVVLRHTHPPGTSADERFWILNFPPILSAEGPVAFRAGLTPGPGGIWSDKGGTLGLVARIGAPAPGLDAGTNFQSFGALGTNEHGDLVFHAQLAGPNVTTDNNRSLWATEGGVLKLVAREGEQAPTLAPGVVFHSLLTGPSTANLPSHPGFNASGDVTFLAELRGTGITAANQLSIWKQIGGQAQLVAQTGVQVPNAAPGVEFDYLTPPMLNAAGRVALLGEAQTTDEHGDIVQFLGIWGEDADHELRLVIRQGDVVDLDRGPGVDLQTILNLTLRQHDYADDFDIPLISLAHGEGGQPRNFNDNGQIAFLADFGDGRKAILVSSLLAVPESSTWALALTALLGMFTAMQRDKGWI